MAEFSMFSLFPNLPPELRLKIWHSALPEKITNLLYTYEWGCWSAKPIVESSERYNNERETTNWSYVFCPELLTGPRFKVNLGFVNREAREVSLYWVRAQSSGLCFPMNTVSPVFRRRFDVSCDTLYVAPDQWADFIREPNDEINNQGLIDREMEIHGQVKQLAISETLLRGGLFQPLRDLMDYFYSLRVLYIIIDLQEGEMGENIQRASPYRYQTIPGGYIFLWNSAREIFELDGDNNDDETLCQLIEKSIQYMRNDLVYMEVPTFEVRLVTRHLYTSYL